MSNQPPKTVEMIGPAGLAVVNETDVPSYRERGYEIHVPEAPKTSESVTPTATPTAKTPAPSGKKV